MTCRECYERLVGNAEIAKMANVTKAAVSNWVARHADFPKPVARLQMGPLFDREQVETWLAPRVVVRTVGPHQRGAKTVSGYTTTTTVNRLTDTHNQESRTS